MMLNVVWMMTAAVMGFMIGRVSMYGQEEPETAQEGVGRQAAEEQGAGRRAAEEQGAGRRAAGEQCTGRRAAEEQGAGRRAAGEQCTGRRIAEEQCTGRRAAEEQCTRRRAAGEQGIGKQGAGRQTAAAEEKKIFRLHGKKHRAQEEQKIWTVGSPVSGRVTARREGERPAIVVSPDSDRLYAPADGKITRLFPMGNALLFATEFGTELYIQAGEVNDELLVRHYRPRVVQNEVVGKGKLLLEFDRKGLEMEGVSAEVSVCVESCFYGSGVKIAAGERIKAGEDILQVCESALQGELIRA